MEKMTVSVILAHPKRQSFNHAIAQTVVSQLAQNGHAVLFHDLYEENFDPILPHDEFSSHAKLPLPVDSHCREIATADGIVIVHPNWWGQPPAILKGWVDRILRPELAYKFLDGDGGAGIPVGLLRAKAVVVFNTSNTPMDREIEVFGDPLETLWKNCIFGLCGIDNFHRIMFSTIVMSTKTQRIKWLLEVANIINRYFPSDRTA